MPRKKQVLEFDISEIEKIMKEKFPELKIDTIYFSDNKLFIEEYDT